MTRTVGVLGGLGPDATLDFFAKVLRASRAEREQDHLRLLIDNNPQVPDRNAALTGRGASPGPALAGMARGLEAAGADFLVMVCNTAHAYQADIEAAVRVPFVSLIDETVHATLRAVPGARAVGLLATTTCLDAGLYQRAFAPHGVRMIEPDAAGRARFMEVLYRIKAGDTGAAVRADMRALGLALADAGADALVAGCTEVPLVLGAADVPVPLISSTDVLVERTVQYARGLAPLPTRSTEVPS
ncbi:aspartate/glutamate racemase family protein [Deinococcus maricopensis]|uniref:Aspartate racemase n=1 Tax=Deinococcus maricopensis (strain DSM 21211 / LMG 22137 / NRRL B-23946 / LB-34) TaxID=709986 RepID=E8U389_DEIML|nr:amino acid racemase [Deinococcus maricopensis]ADV66034.1 aspartate racemase [Deinococcus maricopensis DSM 21211]